MPSKDNKRSEWTKEVYRDGKICYANAAHNVVHKAIIESFLFSNCHSCRYNYFISQKCWGFSIITENHQDSFRCFYLMFRGTDACVSEHMDGGEPSTVLNMADPSFYDKLSSTFAEYGLKIVDK